MAQAAGRILPYRRYPYEIETEKVTQEVEATGDGKLLEVLVPEGEIAKVGQQICVVDLELAKSGS